MAASTAETYQYMPPTSAVLQQYKRCNCKKAKCLKLYCVCFAAGKLIMMVMGAWSQPSM